MERCTNAGLIKGGGWDAGACACKSAANATGEVWKSSVAAVFFTENSTVLVYFSVYSLVYGVFFLSHLLNDSHESGTD